MVSSTSVFYYTSQSTCTFLAWSLGCANYTVLDMLLPLLYSASSLGRPLVVITFLHQLYLPKFVYAVRTYFHALSTTEIFAQASWQHFPKTNSYLVAIFLWHHRHCSAHLWRSWLTQQQNNKCFLGVSSRPDLSMSKISRFESCFSHKIAKHLCRWAAQQKGYTGLQQY